MELDGKDGVNMMRELAWMEVVSAGCAMFGIVAFGLGGALIGVIAIVVALTLSSSGLAVFARKAVMVMSWQDDRLKRLEQTVSRLEAAASESS